MAGQRLRHHDGNYFMEIFHLQFLFLQVFITWLSHGMRRSLYLYGHHRLIKSIVILCEKSCPCLLSYYIGLKKRDYALSLIVCFIWGSKEVGDVVEARPQRILEFVEVRQLLRIPPNYEFIWQQYDSQVQTLLEQK